MDSLIIQGRFRKIALCSVLRQISNHNRGVLNRNIDWQRHEAEFPLETTNCLVVPILIHQFHKGELVFPHLRCHIVLEGISHMMVQDISFEQWYDL
jgi:hypothetical protein